MFGPDGRNLGWDAKKHLVPFGEYLPWRNTLPPIWAQTFTQLNLMAVDMTPGERPIPFTTSFGRVGSNVCFDSIFPDVMRNTARAGAEMFVLVTNDAWYKKTMALQQHLAHGVLRAVENRRPFLQAANTGASAVVDHTGRIVAKAPTWEPAAVMAEVRPVSEQTPYTRYGDWLSWVLMAGAAAFVVRAARPAPGARGSDNKA
ncbi:Apolipoprotein N-acyltransferase [compost metagenome]